MLPSRCHHAFTVYYFRHRQGTLQKSTFRTCQTGRLGGLARAKAMTADQERKSAIKVSKRRRPLRKPRPGNKKQEHERKCPASCPPAKCARSWSAPASSLVGSHLRALVEKTSSRAGGSGQVPGDVWSTDLLVGRADHALWRSSDPKDHAQRGRKTRISWIV